jgi:hypothetical protein
MISGDFTFMKHLVQTNLESVGKKDFRELYTPEVKKAQLDYANGVEGATPDAEQKYVYEKFKASLEEMPKEITVLPRFDIDSYLKDGYEKIFVDARCGDDANDGSEKSPVATIHAALSLAKAGTSTAICILAGEYTIPETVTIQKELTGTADAPFIFTSYGEGEVLVSSAREIKYADFSPVCADDEMAQRIPAQARGKVLFADLRTLGWSEEDIGAVSKTRRPLLYIDGQIQNIARFPNNSANQFNLLFFKNIAETGCVTTQSGSRLYAGWRERVKYYVERKAFLAGEGDEPSWEIVYTYMGKPKTLFETKADADADFEKLSRREREGYAPYVDSFGNWNMDLGFSFRIEPNLQSQADWHVTESDIAQIAQWKSIADGKVLMYGNTYEGWDYGHYPILSIDKKEDGYYLCSREGSVYGAGASGNSPTGHNNFYIYNAPEALDVPGEWYMDEKSGRLYVYPTENFAQSRIEYAAKLFDLVKVEASNVIINGIHFDKGSERGVFSTETEGVVVQNCYMTNMGRQSVHYVNCERSAVIYNKFKYNRLTSISITAKELVLAGKPSYNVIQNNLIDHPIGTQGGINVGGYLSCASHNTLVLSNLTLGGSASLENVIEYNDIQGGHTDTSDAGLIYMNQFSARGSHIRYNYLHNWRASGCGVYLDDLNSGNYMYCNIIDTTDAKAREPRKAKGKNFIYTSSGHDHVIHNNFCIGRSHIVEQRIASDGKVDMKLKTGVIYSSIGNPNEEGRYPITVKVLGKTYTVYTDMTDQNTSRTFFGTCEAEGYKSVELWCVKTASDSDGDSVSLTFENFDGTKFKLTNYNDRIYQSWLYFSDGCWLGYRFRGFANNFYNSHSKYMTAGSVFEKRFPEVYTYMEMYKQYIDARDKEGYSPDPMERFIRSAAMNNVTDNLVIGVPNGIEKSSPVAPARCIDKDGRAIDVWENDTMVSYGNFGKRSEGYSNISSMIEEYQDKEKPCSFDFRTLLRASEAEQKKVNPNYQSVEFVLDGAGIQW